MTRTFFYDINGSVVAEYEATGGTGYGALKRMNVSAGRLLAVDEVQPNGTKITSYLMSDRQGSTRVLMDAAGAVTSRHDYLPFGEELGAGTGAPGSPTGMRTAAQGYSAADNARQRYADTRLDDATGLDHTLWRKLETRSGRWTTPDPYGKSLSVTNPQSFNRYAYVHNDPVNFVDPSGLDDVPAGPCPLPGSCPVDVPISFDGPIYGVEGMMGDDTGMKLVLPSPDGTNSDGGPMEPEPSAALDPLSQCVINRLAPYFPDLDLKIILVGKGIPDYVVGDPKAYTEGPVLFFKDGQYDPHSVDGLADIGHELTHSEQWAKLGFDFAKQYAAEYAALRALGLDHDTAYRNISFEIEARKKADIIRTDLKNLMRDFGGRDPCPK